MKYFKNKVILPLSLAIFSGLILFFVWQPVIFWGGFSPGKGIRDSVTARLPWFEPAVRRLLFLPEEGTDREWKDLLTSSINPFRYAELWLNQRALEGKIKLEKELAKQRLKDVRISVVVRLRPETENYDDKIAIIELESAGATAPETTRLRARFGAEPEAEVILSRDGGQPIGELKSVGKDGVVEMEIKGLNELIDGAAKYRLSSKSSLELTEIKIWISNGATGDKVGSIDAQVVDDGTFRYLSRMAVTPEEFAADNPEFLLQDENRAVLAPGRYVFDRVVIVPRSVNLRILPGVILRFMPGASLVSYGPVRAEGTPSAPIRFMSAASKPWGVFAVVNTKENKSILRHVIVEDAAPTVINGIIFSGGFAAHYSDVEIYNSEFRRNHGDDGANLKYSQAVVENSRFVGNDFDGLDLDAVSGLVRGNEFARNGNDGLDVSWNKAEIEANLMADNRDKCLSIGEKSTAAVKNNTIKNCPVGIAVKDLSEVDIIGNRIEGNKQGIAVYQKKEIFGGGTARLDGNEFAGNQEDIYQDLQSEVVR